MSECERHIFGPDPDCDDCNPPVYGLVMPFVVVTSMGGLYDDAAFVAGCRYQTVAEVLRREKPDEFASYEYPALLPQLDLLAMHEGYNMTSEPWDEHPDEWALVVFTKTEGDAS